MSISIMQKIPKNSNGCMLMKKMERKNHFKHSSFGFKEFGNLKESALENH